MSERIEALKNAHAAMVARYPVSFEDFREVFDAFEVIPVVGAVLVNGAEVHVAVKPEARGKWLSRRLIHQVLGGILAKHGKVETSVMVDNVPGQIFVRGLGFKIVFIEGMVLHYELDKVRH